MCTVSYVPLGLGNFILTSNRDENPLRITHQPGEETTLVDDQTIICPKDSKAGGTWIAMSAKGKIACLLNGAFIKHKHTPPYNKSRGLILMEYFSYNFVTDFIENTNLNGIENFTLLMLEYGELFELRWDGKEKHVEKKPTGQAHLWSSCTLYNEDIAKEKEKKFNNWMDSTKEFSVNEIVHFHGLNNPNGFILNRPIVQTVSITSIKKIDTEVCMHYYDLLSLQNIKKSINII